MPGNLDSHARMERNRMTNTYPQKHSDRQLDIKDLFRVLQNMLWACGAENLTNYEFYADNSSRSRGKSSSVLLSANTGSDIEQLQSGARNTSRLDPFYPLVRNACQVMPHSP